MEKLKDVIRLADVKPVIELDDADRDPDGIRSSFVLTDEVESGFRLLLEKLSGETGCGAFVKGNFGSGKSHFLSFLYLFIKNLKKDPHPLAGDFPGLADKPFRPVKISLVKHPAYVPLEKTVLAALGREGEVFDREKLFARLIDLPTVIIIDELSEFLRSKPAPGAFHEDVRFLQFLGEFARRNPLWIVASLQEWIEDTGHIASAMWNRIKDRYPVRLVLSASHVEDVIDRRIVIKKPEAAAAVARAFDEFRKYYPAVETGFEAFRKTYPLHPLTVRFLSGLTPIFSRHRGAIHFVIESVTQALEEPADFLITPETVFDCFEERIREVPELSPLVRVAYDYYKDNIRAVLPRAGQAEIGLAAVKILILTEISPFEKKKTAKDIAEILFRKISTVRESVNYEYIRDAIMEPLAAHQMFVRREGETYYIDPKINEGLKIRARLKTLTEKLKDRERFFRLLAHEIALPHLPLRALQEGKVYGFSWQNTRREVSAFCPPGGRLAAGELEKMADNVGAFLSGYLAVLPLFSDGAALVSAIGSLRSSCKAALLVWAPRAPGGEETAFLEEYLARRELIAEFPALAGEARRAEAEFRETATRLYFEGAVFYGDGTQAEKLSAVGCLPFERLLAFLLDHPLSLLHPDHFRVMPRLEYVSQSLLKKLYHSFIRPGRISQEEAEQKGILSLIRGLMEPLGVVKRRGGSYALSVEPENELTAAALGFAETEEKMDAVVKALRRSRWGLSPDQIGILLASLAAVGFLVPRRGGEPVALKDYADLFTEIDGLRRGRVLDRELSGSIPAGRFIWGAAEERPTPLEQKRMWKAAVDFIRGERERLETIHRFLDAYRDFSLMKRIRVDFASLNLLAAFCNSLSPSLPAEEGLAKVLRFLRDHPGAEEDFAALKRLGDFFAEQFQVLSKYFIYLTAPELAAPPDLKRTRDELLARLEEYLAGFKSDFAALEAAWEEFFASFRAAYTQAHEAHYRAGVFGLRAEFEKSAAAGLLKRIAAAPSIKFENEWWDVKRELDRLPSPCRADRGDELFLKPRCGCGFVIGQALPALDADPAARAASGLAHFIRLLAEPAEREKLEAYCLGLKDRGRGETADRISALLRLKPEPLEIEALAAALTDEVINEIENALKGRWKIREVSLEPFLHAVRNRRLPYLELKKIFLEAFGRDEETILWIRDEKRSLEWMREDLSRFGAPGRRVAGEILDAPSPPEDAEEAEKRLEKLPAANEAFSLKEFRVAELCRLLESEKIGFFRKKIRGEIIERVWGKMTVEPCLEGVRDEPLTAFVAFLKIWNDEGRRRGAEVFARVIAPLNYYCEKLLAEAESGIGFEHAEKCASVVKNLHRSFETDPRRLEGALALDELEERLSGTVVVLDGLRFDLWHVFRETLLREGFRIEEGVYAIQKPSTTAHFREALGIKEEGALLGKSYRLLTWAEHARLKGGVKRLLKANVDIKFLHLNFIDTRLHGSTLDLYPLYSLLASEFNSAILPLLKEIKEFFLLSDHGFVDRKRMKDRYTHGGGSAWETILPFALVKG